MTDINASNETMIGFVSQADCVYGAYLEALMDAGLNIADLDTTNATLASYMTKEIRNSVKSKVLAMFNGGVVNLKGDKWSDSKYLGSYVSGLITNWMHKDKRLNGGTKYASVKAREDASVKAMRLLQASFAVDSDEYFEIQVSIASRLGELEALVTAKLEASKASRGDKKSKVKASDLPEALRHLMVG